MFYYISRSFTPTFPTGVVKTESEALYQLRFTLGTVAIAVINFNTYPFFGFLRSDLLPCRHRNRFFRAGCTMPPDSKKIELGSSNQVASSSAGKNTGVILVPYRTYKCVTTAISSGLGIS